MLTSLSSTFVKDAADALRKRDQVPAVQPNALDVYASGLEPRRERNDLLGASLGVISIDEKGKVLGRDCAKLSNAVVSSS